MIGLRKSSFLFKATHVWNCQFGIQNFLEKGKINRNV